MNTKTQTIEYSRKIWFWGLLSVLFVLIVLYGYFVNTTILHIVERKSLEKEASFVSASIAEFEADYLEIKRDITPELAYELGFMEAESVKFASHGETNGLAARD